MLFTAPEFLFAFLPVVLVIFYGLGRFAGHGAATLWLLLASLFFYGWWKPEYLLLLMGSIGANFLVARALWREGGDPLTRKWILGLGVTGNLLLLGVYKYLGFFGSLLTGRDVEALILPLAISFFTFQQISFLVDAYKREGHAVPLRHYALFVTFFPHLIAGPLVHHKDMTPQFSNPGIVRFDWMRLALGGALLCIGLFKKGMIADGIAPVADKIFATGGRDLSFADAWSGVLAYTLQLYFDFSGYSDMAIGLAIMFGITLPLNFFSPYKATSMIDFWRRWHITLSNFLREYLYIPLGGNRKGPRRRWINLGITMLLGGLWHGASITFVVWGALHGLFLGINHAYRSAVQWRMPRVAGWVVTFIAVMVAWVFFRAKSLPEAYRILEAMFFPPAMDFHLVTPLGGIILLGLMAGVCLWPNTAQITATNVGEQEKFNSAPRLRLAWKPTLGWAIACGAMAAFGLGGSSQQHAFLYFNF